MYSAYGPSTPMQAQGQPYGAYGAAQPGFAEQQPQMYQQPMPPMMAGAKSPFARGQRRINVAAVATSLFIPIVFFAVVFSVCSFSLQYTSPGLVTVVSVAVLVAVLGFAVLAFVAFRRQSEGADPKWYAFCFATGLLAWVVAFTSGKQNYAQNTLPYLDISNLNVYPSVDPSKYRGQQLMDAGRIIFTRGSHLDLSKSMGFRNGDTYCVAPITSGPTASSENLDSYDFWAVGTNCCSGHEADFHCGEYNNPRATSGLRLMKDGQRSFFRLAVQQAEAAYNIKAGHPIFFHWMQDPIAEINAYQDDAYKYFLLGLFSFAAFQLFATAMAAITFSRMSA